MNNKIISVLVGVLVICAVVVWYVFERGGDAEMFEEDAVVNAPVVAKREDIDAHYKDGT